MINILDINIKKYGMYIFIYIALLIILLFNGFYKQAIMILFLSLFYAYYKQNFSGIKEFKETYKSELSNLKNHVMVKEEDVNNDLSIETSKYDDIKGEITIICNKCEDFIEKWMPELERPELIIDTNKFINDNLNLVDDNKNKIKSIKEKYLTTVKNLLMISQGEQLNYYQKLKKYEDEISRIIHNIIFVNNKSVDHVEKFISDNLKRNFTVINNKISKYVNTELNKSGKINKYSEYLPENDELNTVMDQSYMM